MVTSGVPFTIQGTAKNPQGIRRVQVEIQDRDTKRYLQDDGVTWGGSNNIYATLGTPGGGVTPWSLPVTITGNHNLQIMAKTYGTNGTNDATKAVKKIESFSFDDQTPTTNITGPSGIQTSTTFTMTGTATDDHGVNSLTYWFRDENQNYLQNDGTVGPDLQHVPRRSRRGRSNVGHLVVRGHPPPRGRLAGQRHRSGHGWPG